MILIKLINFKNFTKIFLKLEKNKNDFFMTLRTKGLFFGTISWPITEYT